MKAFILGLCLALFSQTLLADWKAEKAKIDYLLQKIEHLEASFVRNGLSYPGPTAANHLRSKLDQALMQNFFGEPEYTVQDFIEEIASRSFITGEDYTIRFPNGGEVTARDWLYQTLAACPTDPQCPR